MMTLMMLKDIMNSSAYEKGLQSVIDRLSPEGIVAHEEDVGSQAESRRVAEALGSDGVLKIKTTFLSSINFTLIYYNHSIGFFDHCFNVWRTAFLRSLNHEF